jgi:fructose-1,6-bisphosphatase/inositol monophosphatase family enzyme
LVDLLGFLLEEVAETEILPHFGCLAPGESVPKPNPKDPDDLVTVADRAAEKVLERRLCELLPGSLAVGEEAYAMNPELLRALGGEQPVWVVDPLDGTKNFAQGRGPFGTMVALVKLREILVSAIYLPLERELYQAELGSGTTRNGSRLPRPQPESGSRSGAIYDRFMPPELARTLWAHAPSHAVPGTGGCAAFEYTELVCGRKDFVLYYRLFPWDHAPGALILREAGGAVRHPEGREYEVLDEDSLTLSVARAGSWNTISADLFGPEGSLRRE